MRPVDIKTINQRVKLASKRRRNFSAKRTLITAAAIILAGGVGYALFYASWFRVQKIEIQGVNEFHQPDVQKAVDKALDRTFLGIPTGRDILFVHAGTLQADLSKQFSFLDGVKVQKNYFHTITVIGTERQADGVWCFNPPAGGTCKYFDHAGVAWGDAVESSGFLLLNVDDLRSVAGSASMTIDTRFLSAIQTVVPALTAQGVKVKNIIIPAESFTEFDVSVIDPELSGGTALYPVKFSLDSDLPGQLEAFRIFRGQKAGDATFRPQYIDMRFDGRVYFK